MFWTIVLAIIVASFLIPIIAAISPIIFSEVGCVLGFLILGVLFIFTFPAIGIPIVVIVLLGYLLSVADKNYNFTQKFIVTPAKAVSYFSKWAALIALGGFVLFGLGEFIYILYTDLGIIGIFIGLLTITILSIPIIIIELMSRRTQSSEKGKSTPLTSKDKEA